MPVHVWHKTCTPVCMCCSKYITDELGVGTGALYALNLGLGMLLRLCHGNLLCSCQQCLLLSLAVGNGCDKKSQKGCLLVCWAVHLFEFTPRLCGIIGLLGLPVRHATATRWQLASILGYCGLPASFEFTVRPPLSVGLVCLSRTATTWTHIVRPAVACSMCLLACSRCALLCTVYAWATALLMIMR